MTQHYNTNKQAPAIRTLPNVSQTVVGYPDVELNPSPDLAQGY